MGFDGWKICREQPMICREYVCRKLSSKVWNLAGRFIKIFVHLKRRFGAVAVIVQLTTLENWIRIVQVQNVISICCNLYEWKPAYMRLQKRLCEHWRNRQYRYLSLWKRSCLTKGHVTLAVSSEIWMLVWKSSASQYITITLKQMWLWKVKSKRCVEKYLVLRARISPA